jgi:hypothetical protein
MGVDRKTQPYAKRTAPRGIWVEPSLLAEIEYRAKSDEGKVRHPFSRAFGKTYDENGLAQIRDRTCGHAEQFGQRSRGAHHVGATAPSFLRWAMRRL